MPHVPQLFGSVCTLTQAPPHTIELVHTQLPATHVGADTGHRTPHWPQLFASVCSFTHTPPQAVCPLMRHAQAPPWQICTAKQAAPHPPQLFASVCSSTHTPLQTACPGTHARTAVPVPAPLAPEKLPPVTPVATEPLPAPVAFPLVASLLPLLRTPEPAPGLFPLSRPPHADVDGTARQSSHIHARAHRMGRLFEDSTIRGVAFRVSRPRTRPKLTVRRTCSPQHAGGSV
jgi:hypothetical protein